MPVAPRCSLILALMLLVTTAIVGCQRDDADTPAPSIIDQDRIIITAFISYDSIPEEATVTLLEELQAAHPDRVQLRIFDVIDDEGRAALSEEEFDTVAIRINEQTTVSWGEDDERRTVSFLYPPGFAWNHDDLRQAVGAALRGELRPAEPEEAEGVRLIGASVRGQAIRVGDAGDETGQLVINDEPVISVVESHGDLAPGQRVTLAATALEYLMERPFTPDQLSLERADDGVSLMAGEEFLMVATEADAQAEQTTPRALASSWLRSIRRALIVAVQPEPVALPPAVAAEDG